MSGVTLALTMIELFGGAFLLFFGSALTMWTAQCAALLDALLLANLLQGTGSTGQEVVLGIGFALFLILLAGTLLRKLDIPMGAAAGGAGMLALTYLARGFLGGGDLIVDGSLFSAGMVLGGLLGWRAPYASNILLSALLGAVAIVFGVGRLFPLALMVAEMLVLGICAAGVFLQLMMFSRRAALLAQDVHGGSSGGSARA
jgi:hypothetical protein